MSPNGGQPSGSRDPRRHPAAPPSPPQPQEQDLGSEDHSLHLPPLQAAPTQLRLEQQQQPEGAGQQQAAASRAEGQGQAATRLPGGSSVVKNLSDSQATEAEARLMECSGGRVGGQLGAAVELGRQDGAGEAGVFAGASGSAASTAWPIAFSAEVEELLRRCRMTSPQCRERTQRYAASILRTLLQEPIEEDTRLTQKLEVAAAPAAGESGVTTTNTFRQAGMACKALKQLGLLDSQRPPGVGKEMPRRWSVPAEEVNRARAVVAAAEAAGAFASAAQDADAAAGTAADSDCIAEEPAAVAAEEAGAEADGWQAAGTAAPAAAAGTTDGCSTGQQGSKEEGEDSGDDCPAHLASLTWPLPLPQQFAKAHQAIRSSAVGQKAQTWAAAMLQVLQGGSFDSRQLASKTASAVGDRNFDLAGDGGSSPHSLARQLLKHLGLVQSSKQQGTTALLWSLAPGSEAVAAAARVVAGAQAAGELKAGASEIEKGGGSPAQRGTSKSQRGKLTWPLRLPESVLSKGNPARDGKLLPLSPDMQARVLHFCAAILQVLLEAPQGSLDSGPLLVKAAPVAGEPVPASRDCKPYRLARDALVELGLLHSSRQPANGPLNWSIPQSRCAAAASLEQQACAAGVLKHAPRSQVACQPGDAARLPTPGQGTQAVLKRSRQPAEEPRAVKARAASAAEVTAAGGGTAISGREGGQQGSHTKASASQPGGRPPKQQAKRKQPAADGAELVGRFIRVKWDDGATYGGTVTGFDSAAGKHTVRYEDNEVWHHDLSAVGHEVLPPAQPAQGSPPAKRSKGGGTAARAVPLEGAAGRSGQKGGGKRQKQQQGVPQQGSKPAGGAAAAAAAAGEGVRQPAPPALPTSRAAAAAGAAAGSGDGAAPPLPRPEGPEMATLLVEAAGQHSLMPIVEVLLDVARWAGVPVLQCADFGEAFLELAPEKRLLWYRRLWRAANQQDADGVRQLMVGDGAPGRGKQLIGKN